MTLAKMCRLARLIRNCYYRVKWILYGYAISNHPDYHFLLALGIVKSTARQNYHEFDSLKSCCEYSTI